MEEPKKITVQKLLLISYIVLSALFIIIVWFNYLKYSVYSSWYDNWVANTINSIISKANEKCEAFTVYSWNNKVWLVNVTCLQKQDWQTNNIPTQETINNEVK